MAEWKVEKITLPIIVAAAALILVLGALKETEEQNLEKRLQKWRAVLPTDIRARFDTGQDEKCAAMIEERLKTDAAFRKRYLALQDEELTPVFSPRDMVDYYRVYFAGRLDEIRATRGGKSDLKKLEGEAAAMKTRAAWYKVAMQVRRARERGFFAKLVRGADESQPMN